MKEKKMKIGISCLVGAAAVQLLSYAVDLFRLTRWSMGSDANSWLEAPMSAHAASGAFPALIVIGIFFTIKGLREDREWAWVTALALLLLCSAGWALPLSIVGLLHLLDAEVRREYIARLGIAI